MIKVKVGLGTCGISAGAEKVFAAFKDELVAKNLPVKLQETGCMGNCYDEVLVEVDDGGQRYLYRKVDGDMVRQIVGQHLIEGQPVKEWLVPLEDNPFFKDQVRIVLRNCGRIDPNSIDEYIAVGGYRAIQKVIREMTPERVIDMIIQSGLRGRGGGGFPTGMKWKFAREAEGQKKYIICNADEGDPGAFMDRSALEGDPHLVLEGMMICAYAVGADEGVIYCRAEYPLAVKRLKQAIAQCQEKGFLGKGIFGTGMNLSIKIKEGAGAFVCGEETALMASIEGRRGMPRFRPPFPAQKGLWGCPTNINNVETYANVSWIIENGPEAFAAMGTEKSKGTKVFALAGKVLRSGLAEVPMGMTLGDVVLRIGGGIKEGKTFKAVQMGGPSGGCIPASMAADLKIDYDEVTRTGAIMGSGGLIVLDETTCMVDFARYFLTFTQNESCGKCTFCRIGTKRMMEILQRICEGKGKPEDIPLLEKLAQQIRSSSLCGLGQTAPNPVLTTLKYFREEYEAHIYEKRCPALACTALITYEIDPEKCTGCTLCARKCPVKAIVGEVKKPHRIDQSLCIKCGLCQDVCRFGAVDKR